MRGRCRTHSEDDGAGPRDVASPHNTKAQKWSRLRLGLGSRLLLAFLGICGLAIIGAALAIFSFREIGQVLDRITGKRVPAALALQELSRQAERIVSAAPALVAAATPADRAASSHRIAAELQELASLLKDLEKGGADREALGSMQSAVGRLQSNLESLNTLVAERAVISDLKGGHLRGAFITNSESQGLLTPWLQIVDGEIAQSRGIVDDPTLSANQRVEAGRQLAASMTSFQALQRVQFLITSVSDRLQQIATTDEAEAVRVHVFRIQQSLRQARDTTGSLDPRLQPLLTAKLDQFQDQVEAVSSIPELRLQELEIAAQATRRLAENGALSQDLTEAADRLVSIAKHDIAQANEEVLSVQKFSETVLVSAVGIIVISSILIVWLYVGRSIVSRLTALSRSMLAIAEGNLAARLPTGGNDEIAEMGRVVELLRKNTLERDELLIDKAQAAERLEKQVEERTTELAQSISQLRALGEVTQAVNSTIKLETVLSTIIAKAVQLSATEAGTIYVFDQASQEFHVHASYGMEDTLIAAVKDRHIRLGETMISQAVLQRRSMQVADAKGDTSSRVLDVIQRAGYRALLTVPLLSGEGIIGALVVRRKAPGEFLQSTIDLLETFGAQSVLAIQNARLFQEVDHKSQELEIASKHKSQFLANMSHELRTPLNAILGYTELILDSVYGKIPDRMHAVLQRIERNGKHLLGLINDVLDLSKIEAGQLTLSLAPYSLKDVVQSVYSAVEPLAADKNLAFKIEVARDLPRGIGDERRLTQVLLNLVGNAIKFTDQGEVAVKASANNGAYTLAVCDTGPGISTADQAKLFQEFQQADNSITKKKGGTGLGLAISRRIVEMHGGRIWVESSPGHGSTFAFTLPVTVEEQVRPT
jgi:signal transduction histidine kinase